MSAHFEKLVKCALILSAPESEFGNRTMGRYGLHFTPRV